MISTTMPGRVAGSASGIGRMWAVGSDGTRCQSRSLSLTIPTSAPAGSTTGSAVTAFAVISSVAASTDAVCVTVWTGLLMMSLARMTSPLGHLSGQVDEPVGVAPLVVVPAEDLHQAAMGLGQGGVEHAGCRVADDVGGDERRLGVADDAVHRGAGGGCGGDGVVDLLGRDFGG